MAIIDAILLLDELDILEIRLHELDPIVDIFLIVEANRTFSGKLKPMNFLKNQKRFTAFLNKIIYWQVKDMPAGDNPWEREKHQRNSIAPALKFIGARAGDRVLVSDVDEIPRASAVQIAANYQEKVIFELRLFYYYINVRGVSVPWWKDLRMARVGNLKNNPQQIRDKHWSTTGFKVIPDAGWHFSYLGGVKGIQKKIAAFSHHREYNMPKFTNEKHLKASLAMTKDIFNRKFKWERVPIDNSFPKYLLENLDRFNYMIMPKNTV